MHLVVLFLLHLGAEDPSRQMVDPVPAVARVALAVLVAPEVRVLALVARVLVAAPVVLQLVAALVAVQVAAAVVVASVVVLVADRVVVPEVLVALVALQEHAADLVAVAVHHSVVPVASVAIWKSSSRPRCRCISLRTHQSLKAKSLSSADQQHETLVRSSTALVVTSCASCSCKEQQLRLLSP